jgi:uncharacterized protein (DUF1810 family)
LKPTLFGSWTLSDVYEEVTKELTEGRKQTHWMWFVFPQLEGLGHSSMAQRYAIRDLDQARRYLAHPLLGSRLRRDVRLMTSHKGKSAWDMLGSPDDLKFRSCLTLFAEAASDDSDQALFKQALDQFYGGQADSRTAALNVVFKYFVLKASKKKALLNFASDLLA